MKAQDQYLKFVRWEEADQLYVGYCPDLFPWGGVSNDSARNISGVPCKSNQTIRPKWIGIVAVTARGSKMLATDFLEPTLQLPAIP